MSNPHLPPGTVLYLDQSLFRTSGVLATRWPDAPPHGYRPFVLVESRPDVGVWLALTTRDSRLRSGIPRLHIPREQKSGTNPSWHEAETYLDDSAYVYLIPWPSLTRVRSTQDRGTSRVSREALKSILADMNSTNQLKRRGPT